MSAGVELHDFRDAFVSETEELTATANAQALLLETAIREGTSQGRPVRELFRAVHTIKGLAAMVNVEPIVALAHSMEELLRDADRNGVRVQQASVEAILAALDAIAQRVKSVATGAQVAEPPADVLTALELPRAGSTPRAAATNTESVFALEESVASHLAATDRQQLVQGVLEGKRALRLDFSPSPKLAEEGHTITSVRERLGTVAEIVKVVPMTDASAPSGLSFVLLLLSKVDDAAIAEAIQVVLPPPREIVTVRSGAVETNEPAAQADAVRVDVGRLDIALDRLSDLVITRFRLNRAALALKDRGVDVRDLMDVIKDNARQLRDLRAAVLRVRMVPLDELFARMRLVVRGTTRGSTKQVRLDLDAGGCEVDKGVAEHIFPAIIHLARNAVDHGLELPHERQRVGKAPEGVLQISCRQSSSTQIEIRIEDDGRGIDAQRISDKAGVKLVPSMDALLELLCAPGFSTRDAADATSGRGMGMDIVKRAIVEQLGGAIVLETAPGRGTCFILKVPLTIAIVDAFVFSCAAQRFVTPSASIEEAIDVAAVTRPNGGNVGVIVHRGAAVPFVELADLLHVPHTGKSVQAFIVRRQGELVAIGVEKIFTQQEIVVRPLEDKLVKSPGINGATDLGDGTPTLVLDLLRIASAKEAA